MCLLGFLPISSFGLRQQSVGVTGRLFCGDKPSSNVLVKLFDKDTGLDPDDQLDSTRTDAMGNFKVQGDERETTNIDPELKIYHHCNKGLNPCPRKWIITIPDKWRAKRSTVFTDRSTEFSAGPNTDRRKLTDYDILKAIRKLSKS
uniref:Transthyretin-like family protein n=1 Tax=Globodera rostochiensis TaxID=31243 RepID=A0A914IBK4_GLORO